MSIFGWVYKSFVIYISVKILKILWAYTDQYILSYYREPINYKSYGQWAVLTGSTDGIGKGFARGLAGKGVDICLISRSEDKLKNTAKEIEQAYGVKTKYIVADLADPNIYDHIKENLSGLDIGILVNSAGIANKHFEPFSDQDIQFTKDFLNVRITSITMMISLVLPCMMKKKRGLIINISSVGSELVVPYLSEYCAIKTYVTKLGKCLHYELKQHNIQVTTFISGSIRTKLLDTFQSDIIATLERIFPTGMLTPDQFAEKALRVLNSKCAVSCGYFVHDITLAFLKLLPLGFLLSFLVKPKTS